MADEVPAAIRRADVNIYKCASRAAQLQTAKPIIAYWCEYWVVNQILAKELHTKDASVLEYTTRLMDKLERTKTEYENEPAVTDDVAGQACVEQFAQETMDRAQRVVKANKVTAQTALTFDAAATFFSLVHIWGTPDQEILQRIKYAKWNAARIHKAIKDGVNPNDSNPKPEDLPAQEALDPGDPEVQSISTAGAPAPRPVSVDDVPDHDGRRDSAGVSLPHSPVSAGHPSSAHGEPSLPEIPPTAPGILHSDSQPPIQPGYFDPASMPRMPSPMSPAHHTSNSYQTPGVQAPAAGWVPTPSPPVAQSAFSPPPIQEPQPPPTFAPSSSSTAAIASPPTGGIPTLSQLNMAPSAGLGSRPMIPPPTAPAVNPGYERQTYSAPAPPPQQIHQQRDFVVDEKAMSAAQKHARWAISALNFEDVPTAVKELRRALESLGAS